MWFKTDLVKYALLAKLYKFNAYLFVRNLGTLMFLLVELYFMGTHG